MPDAESLAKTPLHGLHVAAAGRMVPFAGYDMPVQYKLGIVKEHLHTRAAAGLFDVSHMGQLELRGTDCAAALEKLVPADVAGLAEGRLRYSQFTNESGGILDDLMIANGGDHLGLVVNAACKASDIAHLEANLGSDCRLEYLQDRALLALQGPEAAMVLARHCDLDFDQFAFMSFRGTALAGIDVTLGRSGYTGEDGFEISVDGGKAVEIAELLLAEEEVEPIGLGARDSLRLEAGLCLYGHDIDETTTPVEAGLQWSIGKRRREEGGFSGADVILGQLANGAARKRVGLAPEGRAPLREHTELKDATGAPVGEITSGGFGPSLGAPVAMGYVSAEHAAPGTDLAAELRGKQVKVTVAAMPMVPARYFRIKK